MQSRWNFLSLQVVISLDGMLKVCIRLGLKQSLAFLLKIICKRGLVCRLNGGESSLALVLAHSLGVLLSLEKSRDTLRAAHRWALELLLASTI